MKTPKFAAVVLCILFLLPAPPGSAAKTKEINPWQQWLDEVDPIMSSQERPVARMMQTLEERKRFQDLFWKARNPNPHDPENKYKIEFYRRLDYAKKKLDGVNSDRGRIYIILGKPFRTESYSGEKNLVDCEMWEYRTEGQHGLFPFMNFIFYKPNDMGDYQLYQPGIHTPRELLSPYLSNNTWNPTQAYHQVKLSSGELAQASLSIVAGEGAPGMDMSLSSSSFALNKVYTLPEREAEVGYIRTFTSPTGKVEVTHSTDDVRGYGYLAVTRNKNMLFLNYAMMPETLNMKFAGQDTYTADIVVDINIEDDTGKLIYQNERKVELKVNPGKKLEIDKRKIVFMNFAPIIEGDFNVTVMLINKSTQEFFTYKEKISIAADKPQAAVGFMLKPLEMKDFMPFAAEDLLLIVDPRCTFTQKENLEGIVCASASQPPEIFLESITNKEQRIKIEPLVKVGDLYKFSKPLADVKDDNYRLILTVTSPGSSTTQDYPAARKIHVLPFYMTMERPVTMAKPEPLSATNSNNYIFIQGQQYLNAGNTDRALEVFNKIPPEYRNGVSIPVIARAHYLKKEYARVVEMLGRTDVPKVYATVIMLANSAIELKMFAKAVQYLEQLRKYGDTVEVNHLLAASYLSLGQQDKAKQYYQHAKELLKK
ncbi:MAG: GWxTD domain-containing protein [Candidatus Aminicenantes bacterium]|nr:GWxTD domain-containing protein [Candidatus Aminicenantes bacterium]